MSTSIISYFENTVSLNANKIAVIDGDCEIKFSELYQKANILANEVMSLNCINKPIAVFLPKSIEAIVADIGISFSGNAYMNLDLNTPSTRIHNILERIQPFAIITDKKNRDLISGIAENIPIIIIDEIDFSKEIDLERLKEKLDSIIDTDPLCIINTSGSTGTPKGVVLNHRSYIDYTNWAINTFKFNGSERLGVLSPIIFDHFNFEICLMMFKGSTLILLDNNMAMFPAKLLNEVITTQVDFIFWVPSIMVNIANMDLLTKLNLTNIKMIWFAGEVFPTKQFNYWKRNLPQATFVNLYGPIECTVDCTYYIVEREINDAETIPIGFPCRNTDVIILTDENRIAAINEEGELCVRGTSLAMGYYNNPEKTALSFVQNPLNTSYPEIMYRTGDLVYKNKLGEIIFKGRKDSLVKHLGYRIELGEIEHVIVNTLKLVDNACVVYNKMKKEITVIYESPSEITATIFRKSLISVFPKYMIPTLYICMTILPRNTNGKIDRLALSKEING